MASVTAPPERRVASTLICSTLYGVPGSKAQGSAGPCRLSDPHRHEDEQGALVGGVTDHRRRACIGKLEGGAVAPELARDVEEVARVEADIDRRGPVADG